MNDTNLNLILTCADGLENALLIELSTLNISGTKLRTGRISSCVSLYDFYQICLYSRVASRIMLPLGEYYFKKQTHLDKKTEIIDDIPQVLYTYTKTIDWKQFLNIDHTFLVRVSVDKRVSVNQQFTTLRVKDAIADYFTQNTGKRPSVDNKNPDFIIYVHIGLDMAEISLDLSGGSLHRRGYRVVNTNAPLKENLAAALLYECGWHTKNFDILIDPMCGSGTFITESLLMYLNYPVGIHNTFGFYQLPQHDKKLWQQCQEKAQEEFNNNLNMPLPKIYAFDADIKAIKSTHKNIHASALQQIKEHLLDSLTILCQPLYKLPATLQKIPQSSTPLIITNPPYGERLSDYDLIKPLYQGLGIMLKESGINLYVSILANKIEQADAIPIQNPKTIKCYNGALPVYFRQGYIYNNAQTYLLDNFQKKEIQLPDNIMDEKIKSQSVEFANRIQKNIIQLKKQAKKEQVSNLRIYDADLPNFNMAIDIYGNFVHIQEYAPPKTVQEEIAKLRFSVALFIVRQILNVNKEQVFIKTRKKQSGNNQYSKQNSQGKKYIVQENNAYFFVNFTDYLDTGLFIDHRNMRQIIKSQSKNKMVLNLFAYTCTASVHAALADAKKVVSVDLSENYLQWGKENFALNGLIVEDDCFVCADVFEWIKNSSDKYDLIFIDPPTFSNSKKFKGSFDVQRDHVSLINRAMNRLNAEGVVYFSNNFTRFVLSEELKKRYDVVNITPKTTGFDFKSSLHQSYAIRHKTNMQ